MLVEDAGTVLISSRRGKLIGEVEQLFDDLRPREEDRGRQKTTEQNQGRKILLEKTETEYINRIHKLNNT